MNSFAARFRALTGHLPFPWQEALFARLVEGRFPETCAIPTGIGKTSAIAVWLLALASRAAAGRLAQFPRRLVYVVNRRTVVDQATADVEGWRRALNENPALVSAWQALRALSVVPNEETLGISTLRGQRADNAAWRLDPSRPAIVVGTVDMIGSRLLFAGYGCGFRTKPLHAGFLGQDAWLVHDEAHLEPAFQELLVGIQREQKTSGDLRPFVVTALTATPRNGAVDFELTPDDRTDPRVRTRLNAPKALALHRVEARSAVDAVVTRVLQYKNSGQAILVYLRTVEEADIARDRLARAGLIADQLTGTLRGFERDRFVRENRVFARFSLDTPSVEPAQGTVCLVCTSAGEVGVNMSGDHMVSDLTPFDSMAQRLGRVNRLGTGRAQIDVYVAGVPEVDDGTTPLSEDAYEIARARTAALLTHLPPIGGATEADGPVRYDASPAGLETLPVEARRVAFSPTPVCLSTSDALFDAWALTSIRETMPGRPPVDWWLHGVAPWDAPETMVAWRTEVDLLSGQEFRDEYPPADLLEDYPLKPHEILRDRSDRVFAHLKVIAARVPSAPVWVVDPTGTVSVETLEHVIAQGRSAIEHCTLLLPPSAGGLALDADGISTGRLGDDPPRGEGPAEAQYDVADFWLDEEGRPRRQRAWDDEPAPPGMRLVRTVRVPQAPEGTDDAEGVRLWRWYTRPGAADDQGSRTALSDQPLLAHHERAEAFAAALAQSLGLPDAEARAVRVAASLHDLGKSRAVWQRSIRNFQYPSVVLAKSGNSLAPHSLGSTAMSWGRSSTCAGSPNFVSCRRISSNWSSTSLQHITAEVGQCFLGTRSRIRNE